MANKSKWIVLDLSLKDLKHEWILSICLIMAISAVLSPLLLLFGLKFGIIDWGRNYLAQDPRYREIRPLTSKSFDKAWFARMKNRPDVAFIIPMTRQISATVKANIKGGKNKIDLNIIPTETGDPLILENGGKIPEKGECVLTKFAAESLGAKKGDILVARASRIVGSRYEYGSLELKVVGILTVRASELKSMYVRLPVLEAVERYKDGQAVPEFGWPGSTPKAYPLFDGIVIVLPQKLTRFQELSLCNKTGFTKIESLNKDQLKAKAGFEVKDGMTVYRLYTLHKPAGIASVRSVQNKLRGKNARLFLWASPFSAKLLNPDGKPVADITGYGLSADSEKAGAVGLDPVPSWGEYKGSTKDILKIMLPPDIKTDGGNKFIVRIEKKDGALEFPVEAIKERTKTSGVSFVPERLAGIIRLYKVRNIKFDEKEGEFILFRRGYASFRLYAKSIFQVDGLRRFFDSVSIPVHTEIKEIKKVVELDKGMTLIFWLLAIVGIAGSVASLVASLYASVERKKRELSVLRLIGLSGGTLFRFPVYQGIIFGSGGFAVSMILFSIFSRLINTWFKPYADKLLGFPMEAGVSFCRLPLTHVIGALGVTVLIAAVSAMVAAFRVTGIEPAEALRDE